MCRSSHPKIHPGLVWNATYSSMQVFHGGNTWVILLNMWKLNICSFVEALCWVQMLNSKYVGVWTGLKCKNSAETMNKFINFNANWKITDWLKLYQAKSVGKLLYSRRKNQLKMQLKKHLIVTCSVYSWRLGRLRL